MSDTPSGPFGPGVPYVGTYSINALGQVMLGQPKPILPETK